MLQTVMVKLDPTEEQHTVLVKTMSKFNEACNYIAEIAFEQKCANKINLQKIVYYDVRKQFDLSAQMTIRAIAKVVEAYKRNKSIKPYFRPDGAVVYDQRILSWRGLEAVSILTIRGREIIPIRIGEYQTARMDRVRGQVDLIIRKNIFYLAVVVEVPEQTPFDPVGTLGVDLGIVNLATDSDGTVFSGEQIDNTRERYATLRGGLQSTGTKSAKRHLKKLSGKEQRFHRDVNHCISKEIVTTAKDTGRAIALEDLTGIRDQITVRKEQRSRHHSWGFYQLRQFIEYKAAVVGVPVEFIDPRYTSRTCPCCGCIDKKNRPNRNTFNCIDCGLIGSADYIAAINIANRAAVGQPIVPWIVEFNHLTPLQEQASLF
ncbi:MAG: RNA-guided endonuclease InsQ/TnpB family protein [Methanosarcinaceae archaeon]